jgi:hypothetical protein
MTRCSESESERVHSLTLFFVHYKNLERTIAYLEDLLQSFHFLTLSNSFPYLLEASFGVGGGVIIPAENIPLGIRCLPFRQNHTSDPAPNL